MSLEKRIEALEWRLGTNHEDEQAKRKHTEERRAEILERLQRVLEQEGEGVTVGELEWASEAPRAENLHIARG